MSRRTRVGLGALGAAAAAAVAAALVTGGGPAAQQSPSPVSPAAATASASSAPAAAPHGDDDLAYLRAQLEESVPPELRADLAALRDVPAAQRLTELERIRDAALAGEYGPEAKAGAERLGTMLAMLPPTLSADLEELATTEEAEIPDAVEQIRDRALAGGYGPQVQGYAQRLVDAAQQHGYDVTGDLDRYVPAD